MLCYCIDHISHTGIFYFKLDIIFGLYTMMVTLVSVNSTVQTKGIPQSKSYLIINYRISYSLGDRIYSGNQSKVFNYMGQSVTEKFMPDHVHKFVRGHREAARLTSFGSVLQFSFLEQVVFVQPTFHPLSPTFVLNCTS